MSNIFTSNGDIPIGDPDFKYTKHSILVSSRDRDRITFPNTNQFSVQFNGNSNISNIPNSYKNVHSLELVQAVIPQAVLGVSGVPYLTLEITELENTSMSGSNDHLERAFALLSPQDVYGTTHLASKFYYKFRTIFKPEKATLNKMTFSFRAPNGNLFDFGIDTASGNPVNEDVQVLLYFIIETKDPILKENHTFFR